MSGMPTRAIAIVTVVVGLGGSLVLAWRSQPAQTALLWVGDRCFKSDTKNELVCAAVISVAANLVTKRLPAGRVLLEGAEEICASRPGLCLWLTGIVGYQITPEHPENLMPDFRINSISPSKNDINQLRITSPLSDKILHPPKIYHWQAPASDLENWCKTYPTICQPRTEVGCEQHPILCLSSGAPTRSRLVQPSAGSNSAH